MERLNKIKGYFYCQEYKCNFKCKRVRHLVYFHGKVVCHNCKLKLSEKMYIPKLEIKDSSLRARVKLEQVEVLK